MTRGDEEGPRFVLVGERDGHPCFWVKGKKFSAEYPDANWFATEREARNARRTIPISEVGEPSVGTIEIVSDYGTIDEVRS